MAMKHHQRWAPLILLLFTLATLFFLYRHTRTQQQLKETELLHQQQEQLEEQERLRWIETQRTVHEPVLNRTDHQSLSQTHDIAFPTPLPPWTDADNDLLDLALGGSLRAELLTTNEKIIDFKQMTTQLRVYKSMYQYFDPIQAAGQGIPLDSTWLLFETLEQQLYPWLQPHWDNVFGIHNTSSGQGIVMCVGNDQFHFAMRTIQTIRTIFDCDLPIQVFAIDDDDLSPKKRRTLESTFKDLTVHNIVDAINTDGTEFSGWALKPFAVLASRFSEVILMDADVYFFQSPSTLFDDPGYKATGTLFFYDRTLFGDWHLGRRWLASFLPSTSSLVPQLRWWNFQSAHEQESGVVVIDKHRSLMGLMATCKINAKRERDEVSYKHVHGDKETFWIGYEMVQTPYAFVKSHGGVVGGLGDGGDPTRVCGNILHFDAQQRPYWWNGGLLRDKNKWPDRYLMFTHYAQGEDWDFETSCIKETDRIREFNTKEKEYARLFMKYDKEMKRFDDIQ